MAHALEVRSPLPDQHVKEFPGDLKLRCRTTKWLLMRSLPTTPVFLGSCS
jgi:hypothetical protein